MLIARNADSGYSTSRTPTDASSCVVKQRRLAELGEIREHRHVHRRRELPVFIERGERFGEDHVGARFDVLHRAIERGLLAFDRVRIGARHHDELLDRCGRRPRT